MEIGEEIRACTLCAERFAATATAHAPRPVVWFQSAARILIAGQAPGARVHASGRPFDDPSGERLRDWLGITPEIFYDQARIAIVPMAFCFPGYDAKGSDLPPPALCRQRWHQEVLESLTHIRLRIVIGSYAQRYHLKSKTGVTETVQDWRSHAPGCFPLPHPSWRNTAWLKRHPWFTSELLPALRETVQRVLA